MNIRARKKQDVIIFDLSGRIDVDSANFVEAVGQCVHEGYPDVLCNFEDVESIDYMGISVIVIGYKEVINNGGRMRFVNVPSHLKGILSVAGLDRTIETFASEETAINSFKEDAIIENIKKMQLRRRFKRLPLDIKIEIRPRQQEGGPACSVEMLNLSAVGCFLFGCDKFKIGDEVMVKLKLPPHNQELNLAAKVAWLTDKQVQRPFHPGIGLSFDNISSDDQQKIVSFIDRNLSFLSTD
jgi:anti-anti-sigma factor